MKFDESSSERPGVFVEAADGRLFFLPTRDAEKFVIESVDQLLLRQLMRRGRAQFAEEHESGGQPVISPLRATAGGCRAMLRWLLSNDMYTEDWRSNSLLYLDNC